MIKGIVLAFSAVNMPLETSQVLTLVETYLGRHVFAPTITDRLKLWSDEIRQRKTKCLGHKRIASEIVEHVDSFCVYLEEAIVRRRLMAHNCINYDETRLALYDSGQVKLERIDKRRGDSKLGLGVTLGSLVPFVSADGVVLMSVIILKATDVENHQMGTIKLPLCSIAHLFRSKHPVYFCATESGYTNKCLNSRILQKFVEHWVERSPGLHCYVFSDQLSSHFDIATIQTALLIKRVSCCGPSLPTPPTFSNHSMTSVLHLRKNHS